MLPSVIYTIDYYWTNSRLQNELSADFEDKVITSLGHSFDAGNDMHAKEKTRCPDGSNCSVSSSTFALDPSSYADATSKKEITLTDLKPYTYYYIHITARNAYGTLKYSGRYPTEITQVNY